MLNYDEYNQVLAEKYEERIDKHGQRVALKYDFIPQQDFYITMDLMIQKLMKMYEASFEQIKKELASSAESYWMEQDSCIIIKYKVFGDKLFQEIPKAAFLWPHEVDAELDKHKDPTWH
jgi:transcriptional regulatory protein LevR